MSKIIFNWVILFLYMFFIFYFSSLEKVDLIDKMPEFRLKDKIIHFVEYCILSLFVYNAFKQHKFLNEKIIYYTIMFSFIYGITDEIHQSFVLFREFSFYDLFADFLGSSFIFIKKLF